MNDEILKPLVHYGQVLESAELSHLQTLLGPGDVVFDIGANYGLFALRLAECVKSGEIHLFEPNRDVFRCLQQTARGNPGLPLRLHECAVGEQDGTAVFHVPVSEASTHGSLERHEWGVERGIFAEEQEVNVRSIDSLVRELRLRRLDCIKIDVEGTEGAAVRGMQETLDSLKPGIVMCETSVGSEAFEALRARYANVSAATEQSVVPIDAVPLDFWGNIFFTEPR